jgi:UDP-2-acetamido-3-amino-2,3-dideoxy-glucuronate N-acetyltransferase
MTPDQPALPAGVRLVTFPCHIDGRGSLAFGEFTRLIPFECRRFFMVHDVPAGASRGGHAHRTCHQLIICMSGHLRVEVDDGRRRADILLDRPDMGLYVPPMTWDVQRGYSDPCAQLVFASHFYDADDYIHDYSEFLVVKGIRQ